MESSPLTLDVLILGGGAAGLWMLDELHHAGYRTLLLETESLGLGQTIASQGIIHGGLKYALRGRPSRASRTIRDMPLRWRRALGGEQHPNLAGTHLRSDYCCLWALPGLRSRLGLVGARLGLRVKPVPMPADARPIPLKSWSGPVQRLDEQVIEPQSMLTILGNQHRDRCLKIDSQSGFEFDLDSEGHLQRVRLLNPETSEPLDLIPRHVVLAAGGGNGPLRDMLKLKSPSMQTRPLHMVVARGDLPRLNGLCIHEGKPWLTITSTVDCADRTVWQIGGALAEDCVGMTRAETIERARRDVLRALPSLDLDGIQFGTYVANRAEASSRGRRPDGPTLICEGNIMTAWPTKLALVPMLSDAVLELLPPAARNDAPQIDLHEWPRPSVALPPWEREQTWNDAHSAAPDSR